MHPDPLPRRRFLQASALAALAGTMPVSLLAEDTARILGAEETSAPKLDDAHVPTLRVLLHAPDGKPLDETRLRTLHARDLANDPLPQAMRWAEGRARIALAKEPLQVSARLLVPGFGEVYCYADNTGKGYAVSGEIEFVLVAAATRRERALAAAAANQQAGVPLDAETEKFLAAMAKPIPAKPAANRFAVAYEVLAAGLHAGERLVLAAARHRISKFTAPRKDFLFGGLASVAGRSSEVQKLFSDVFNYATTSWYTWKNEQPPEARLDYTRMDNSIAWCQERKIAPKGFGYVYLTNGATPEWLRSWTYDKLLPEYQRVVTQTMRRYDGQLAGAEIINEAHDKANLFRLSQAQILELTKAACAAARAGSPTVKRLINHCCLWAEYAKRPNADGSRRWSPFRYLSDCVRTGVEFETVGLQLYYPSQDLLEIDRMLRRFHVFKRPIQITEISCNSIDGLDAASMRPKSLVPGWHGPWTETMQADWLEAIYTLCYSQSEFSAVGWWDFMDGGGHFWPHGGLLRPDGNPKESYRRLRKLQQTWGVERKGE